MPYTVVHILNQQKIAWKRQVVFLDKQQHSHEKQVHITAQIRTFWVKEINYIQDKKPKTADRIVSFNWKLFLSCQIATVSCTNKGLLNEGLSFLTLADESPSEELQ
jgi:hypothetical protein